jgi:predicted transposase YdaD
VLEARVFKPIFLIISGIALNKEIIQRLLRSEIMKTSVIYQEILLEGKAEGIAQGIAQGITQGIAQGEAQGLVKGEAQGLVKGEAQGLAKGEAKATRQIAINMLNDHISPDLVTKFTGLTLKQVQKLQQLSAKQSQNPKSPRAKRSAKPQ